MIFVKLSDLYLSNPVILYEMSSGYPMTTNRQPTNIGHEKHDTTPCTRIVRPVPHELAGHLHYMDGLNPWKACCEQLGIGADTDLDGTTIAPIETTATYAGQRWTVTLTPKRSGLTPEQVDPLMASIPEFVIRVENADYAGNAPPKATYRISPRTSATVGPNWTGVDIEMKGSNILPSAYPRLLDVAARALEIAGDADLSPDALAETSNITCLEQYVRVRQSNARVLHGDDGPIRRISQHLTTTNNYWEAVDDGRDARSYYGTVGFDSEGARTLINDHRFGKVIKFYDASTPPKDEDHPLHHPKLCVCYEHGKTDGSVYWDDLEDIERELTELLVNLSRWSGIMPLSASADELDRSPFISDEHFDATVGFDPADRDVRVIDDPLPSIEREQRSAVDIAYSEATPAQRDVLEVVADGGDVTDPSGPGMHYEEIGKRAGVSTATVYNTLEHCGDLLQNTAGRVKMVSNTVAESVRSWIGDSDTTDSMNTGGQDTSDDETPPATYVCPWEQWADKHGVTDQRDQEMIAERGLRDGAAQWKVIDLGELPAGWSANDLDQHVREGLEAWKASGRPERTYRGARFRWHECGADESDETIGMSMQRVALESDRNSSDRTQLKSVRR